MIFDETEIPKAVLEAFVKEPLDSVAIGSDFVLVRITAETLNLMKEVVRTELDEPPDDEIPLSDGTFAIIFTHETYRMMCLSMDEDDCPNDFLAAHYQKELEKHVSFH